MAYNPTEGKDYKWYLSGIYCQLGDYVPPTYYLLGEPFQQPLIGGIFFSLPLSHHVIPFAIGLEWVFHGYLSTFSQGPIWSTRD